MTDDEIKAVVVSALRRIAPEMDPTALRADAKLRDELDLDSMDFLNLILALHARLGVEIPESDYAKLSALDGIVAYLVTALGRR